MERFACMVCEKGFASLEGAEVCERKHEAKGSEDWGKRAEDIPRCPRIKNPKSK